jgi:hypothetical protein
MVPYHTTEVCRKRQNRREMKKMLFNIFNLNLFGKKNEERRKK